MAIAQNASYFTKITGTSPFTHLWSLAIEMQFYLIWPLLFWGYTVLERQPEAGPIGWSLLIAASVLSLFLNFQPGEDPSRVYYGSDTRCFALLIGGLIGLRHRPQRKRRESPSPLVCDRISYSVGHSTSALFRGRRRAPGDLLAAVVPDCMDRGSSD